MSNYPPPPPEGYSAAPSHPPENYISNPLAANQSVIPPPQSESYQGYQPGASPPTVAPLSESYDTNQPPSYAPTASSHPPEKYHSYQPQSNQCVAPPSQSEDLYTPPPPAVNSPEFPPSPSEGKHELQPSTNLPTVLPITSQTHGTSGYEPPLPPRRVQQNFGVDDPSNPVHYTRDPHKLIAYLVPFPKPRVHVPGVTLPQVPERFLIYTPPPPPLSKPAEGAKEDWMHKVQRMWEEEVRSAKTSTAKTASWQGIKSKATKGISWAMSQTKSSNLEFLGRIVDDKKSPSPSPSGSADTHAEDGYVEDSTTHKTVGLEEIILVYPSSVHGTQEEIRTEFVNSMMRSKSKAQRDAIIATGLLPVSAAIDILATFVWPFGGLLEIDAVWAFSSIRGAKMARSTTKRLTSSNSGGKDDESKLRLTFTPSPRLEILGKYLATRCHEQDAKLFPSHGVPPTETTVLEAIGWSPSQTGGQSKNWEDEQWEITEVKDDIKAVMTKGAREWDRWCKAFEQNPEKAMKK